MRSGIRILKATAFLLFVTATIATTPVPTVIAANLINGGHISDAISVAGEVDTYTFSADAGDHVKIRMADTSAGSAVTPRIELFGPSGGNAIAAGTSYFVADVAYTLTESIDLGDLDTYTFIADVGESFDIQVTDMSTGGVLIPRIELYGPSGSNFLKGGSGYEVASISHTVTEMGTYTVLMKDVSSGLDATGEYEITCPPMATTISTVRISTNLPSILSP